MIPATGDTPAMTGQSEKEKPRRHRRRACPRKRYQYVVDRKKTRCHDENGAAGIGSERWKRRRPQRRQVQQQGNWRNEQQNHKQQALVDDKLAGERELLRRNELRSVERPHIMRRPLPFLLLCLLAGHSKVNAFVPLSTRPSARIISRPPPCRRASYFAPCARRVGTPTARGLAIALPAAIPSSQSLVAWWYLSLLAVLFGTQPFFQKKYVPKTICRSSIVLAQEVAKFATAASLLWASGGWQKAISGWSPKSWCGHAMIPGWIYVLQNYCTLIAYQNLPPFTFNVLNQTKTLSAALCCYFVIGKPQSKFQVVSLLLLLLSALVIEEVIPMTTKQDISNADSKEPFFDRRRHLISGVIPVLLASFLSGLAGALAQRSVQTTCRNAYLFTMELSVASCLFLILSLILNSPDGRQIANQGFFHGWSSTTVIPVFTKALGGVVVGLVTKHAGAVRKGFALIFGLLLSGILQSKEEGITSEQVFGGLLAAISLWMHSRFPYVAVT